MSKTTKTTGRIAELSRMKRSAAGNPRYLITLQDGRSFRTSPDSMFAYGLDSIEFRGTESIPAPLVSLSIDGRGNVYGVELVAVEAVEL